MTHRILIDESSLTPRRGASGNLRPIRSGAFFLLALGMIGILGCFGNSGSPKSSGDTTSGGGLTPEGTEPDFHLRDVNPHSARLGELVSPRDYSGSISAWYFGHAG